MKEIIILLLFFTIVTTSHGLFLILVKGFKKNRDKLRLWNIHCWVNGILWLVLLILVILAQFHYQDFQPPIMIRIFGVLLCFAGSLLISRVFGKLGFKQAMGYRFFVKDKLKWISQGIYSGLDNPMYDGFILVLVGLALLRGIIGDFYIAAASFLLLNVFLAAIENRR